MEELEETTVDIPTVVLSTAPDAATAESLAEALVASRLAACVNILPGVRSVYVWEGETQRSDEHLLIIKTTDERLAQLVEHLSELHPYECPEVLALGVAGGASAYLEWLSEAVR